MIIFDTLLSQLIRHFDEFLNKIEGELKLEIVGEMNDKTI